MSLFSSHHFVSLLTILLGLLVSASHAAQHHQYQPHLIHHLNRALNNSRPQYSNSSCSFWLEDIQHQAVAPFQDDPSYQVFRNVKDYGAQGDGSTDDTAAINAAISAGSSRCVPGSSCTTSTTAPAVVYFPPGTYVVSGDIIDYYYTSLYGNPNCLPVIKVAANYTGAFVIDANPYGANGLAYLPINVFWRQIRNLEIDTTSVPVNASVMGIHWPSSQASSITNVVFRMNEQNGTQHTGLFIEEGSGGLLSDLVFIGGRYGANYGSQQFTSRNFTFHNCVTAINQLWDWGWTYQQMSFNNVSVGLNMSRGGTSAPEVASIVLFDSEFNDVDVGIIHTGSTNPSRPAAGALVLENVDFNNVRIAIQGPNGTDVAGGTGSFNIPAWVQGHGYYPFSTNSTELHGYFTPNQRPASLLSDGKYYTRSKPQYNNVPLSQFVSARSQGARGDGVTDDTVALQNAINTAAAEKKILYIDGGDYIVTSTLYVPGGSKIVGEIFPVILATGEFWSDINDLKPVVQVGHVGEVGQVEWSDCILSTRGPAPGAVMIEWNLASPGAPPSGSSAEWSSWSGTGVNEYQGPSGVWEVHTRIGGFAGSDLTLSDCPSAVTTNVSIPPTEVNQACIAAAASMFVSSSTRNLYLEGVWLWVADHDTEDSQVRRVTVYAGRGLKIESTDAVWLVGTSVEHHTLYEYQFVNAQNIFAGHLQTESAYYQPNPPAMIPFPAIPELSDPTFPDHCLNGSQFIAPGIPLRPNSLNNTCDGWGLRIVDSSDIYIYGAGLYSFFYNYNLTCAARGYGAECQSRMTSLEGSHQNIGIYGLNTVGVQNMITYDGRDIVPASDNIADFSNAIALFRPNRV